MMNLLEHAEATPSRIETQLGQWGSELQELKAKVDKEIAGARTEYFERLQELRDDIESQVRKWGPDGEGLKELQAEVEAELQAWGSQIQSVQLAADKAETERRLIEDLETEKKAFEGRLSDVKQASDSAWEDVKAGTAQAWDELRTAIQRAIARFE